MGSGASSLRHTPNNVYSANPQLTIFNDRLEPIPPHPLEVKSLTPAINEQVAATQLMVAHTLDKKEETVAQVTYKDLKAIIVGEANKNDIPFENIFREAGGLILQHMRNIPATKEAKRHRVVLKFAEMLRKYRQFYAKYTPEYQDLKQVHDKAYYALLNPDLNGGVVPAYLFYMKWFQSLLGKICYHSADIRLAEDMVVLDVSDKPDQKIPLASSVAHRSTLKEPTISIKDRKDAARHVKELNAPED